MCSDVDAPRDYHTKWNDSGRQMPHIYHSHTESKLRHKRTDLRNRHRTTDAENRLVVAKGRRQGREAEVHRHELLYREWISNKVLLYSTESCLQHSVKTIMEKMIFSKRTHTHIHTHTHTHTYMTAEINTTLLSNYTSTFLNQKKWR